MTNKAIIQQIKLEIQKNEDRLAGDYGELSSCDRAWLNQHNMVLYKLLQYAITTDVGRFASMSPGRLTPPPAPPRKEAKMSLIKAHSAQYNYYISLDTMKEMIANNLGVPAEEITVQYVEGDTGPGDPMDRYPTPRGIVNIKVVHNAPARNNLHPPIR